MKTVLHISHAGRNMVIADTRPAQ